MSKKFIIIILIVGLLIVLAIIEMPLVSRAMIEVLSGSKATKEPIDPYIDQIKAYQDELKRTDLSSETRNLVKEKLNTISMMATQRAEGKVGQPTRQNSMEATPTIQIDSIKLPDGIDNHPLIPFSESVFTVLNSWRKTTVDRYYLVYAGFLTQDSKQGAILILDPSTHDFTQYNTPDNRGGVRVVEEKGKIIILQSTEGNLFYFDVAWDQFVDSNGNPISTPTPTPISPYP